MEKSSEDNNSEAENKSEALHLIFSHLQLQDNCTGVTPRLPSTSGTSNRLDTPASYTVFSDWASIKQKHGNLTTHDFSKSIKTNNQLRDMESRPCSSNFNSFEQIETEEVDLYVNKASSSYVLYPEDRKNDIEFLQRSPGYSFHSDFNLQAVSTRTQNCPSRFCILKNNRRMKNKSGRYPYSVSIIEKTRQCSSSFSHFEEIRTVSADSFVNKLLSSTAPDIEDRKKNIKLFQVSPGNSYSDSSLQMVLGSTQNRPCKYCILKNNRRMKNKSGRYPNSVSSIEKTRLCSSSFNHFEEIGTVSVDLFVNKLLSSPAPNLEDRKKNIELFQVSPENSDHSHSSLRRVSGSTQNRPCKYCILKNNKRMKNKSGRYPNSVSSIEKARPRSSSFSLFEEIGTVNVDSFVNKLLSSPAPDLEDRKKNIEFFQGSPGNSDHSHSRLQMVSGITQNRPCKYRILKNNRRMKNKSGRYPNLVSSIEKTRPRSSSFSHFEEIGSVNVDSFVNKLLSCPASDLEDRKKNTEFLQVSPGNSYSDSSLQRVSGSTQNRPCKYCILKNNRLMKNKSGRYPNSVSSINEPILCSLSFNRFEEVGIQRVDSFVNKPSSRSASDLKYKKKEFKFFESMKKYFYSDFNIPVALSSAQNSHAPERCSTLTGDQEMKNRLDTQNKRDKLLHEKLRDHLSVLHPLKDRRPEEMKGIKRKTEFQTLEINWKKVVMISECCREDSAAQSVDEILQSPKEFSTETRKRKYDPAIAGMEQPSSSTISCEPETFTNEIETITNSVENIRLSREILKSRRDAKQPRSTTVF